MNPFKFTAGLLFAAGLFTISCGGNQQAGSAQNNDTTKAASTNVAVDTPQKTAAAAGSENLGESLTAQSSDLTGTESEFEIVVNLATDVLFDFDKADIKSAAAPELKKVAETIKAKGKGVTKITGYTDAKGDDAYNQTLSEKRAAAIADWFKSNGLSNFQFTTAGKGEQDPIAPNTNADGSDNPDGRAKNRRVTLVINKRNTLGK